MFHQYIQYMYIYFGSKAFFKMKFSEITKFFILLLLSTSRVLDAIKGADADARCSFFLHLQILELFKT